MVTFSDIHQAYQRIQHLIVKTPLLTSDRLNNKLGFRLFVKAEPLQRTGAFKFRGACNAILSLEDPNQSVIAFSSGNHAQAVAFVARLSGRKATIIMPKDAPQAKITATREYGAEVVLYNRYSESREEIGQEIANRQNGALIKPYDHEAVIAGQGTIGIELTDQIEAQGLSPQAVYCCAGGGGLISGLAVSLHHSHPDLPIYAAEPDKFDDIRRSLEAGTIVSNDPEARSLCDAIVTPCPGEITFPIMKSHLAGGVAVTDEDALRAMQTCWRYLKLVVEPGGAVAVAAALKQAKEGDTTLAGSDVIAVASGGNVDDVIYQNALTMEGAF